ncbi:hypothetical protein C7M84_013532 [Penaeus vannamei]|uniref:Uncharacterized protein n=1 Tax=Penaeus vannamei TaxID=6689 RepID=A0A3R7QIA3_PENVA|nr:uncharacterized protein LOC113816279 [Penaeus vannamei]ROT68329.1 hypothetical protein C7M84_013532 [Penaeus vannamei]
MSNVPVKGKRSVVRNVDIEELLSAHRGIEEIIGSFKEEDSDGIIDVTTHLSEGLNTSISSQHVNEFLNDVSVLADAQKELIIIKEKMTRAVQNEKSSALTHNEILGDRIFWCREAELHMRTVIENKDLLIYHLQQPLIANFLTMHHQYHKDLIILIGELADNLNNVCSHIRLIEDHAQNSFLQRSDTYISHVTKVVMELRNTISDITNLQALVIGMLEAQK